MTPTDLRSMIKGFGKCGSNGEPRLRSRGETGRGVFDAVLPGSLQDQRRGMDGVFSAAVVSVSLPATRQRNCHDQPCSRGLGRLRDVHTARRYSDEVIERESAFLLDAGLGPVLYLASDGRVLVDSRDWDGSPQPSSRHCRQGSNYRGGGEPHGETSPSATSSSAARSWWSCSSSARVPSCRGSSSAATRWSRRPRCPMQRRRRSGARAPTRTARVSSASCGQSAS
ncbi:MAG: hypothetical protein JWN44_2971 [Myxococcales bacterium]|nr:hypothetical protein [Myxococcales bacterium]